MKKFYTQRSLHRIQILAGEDGKEVVTPAREPGARWVEKHSCNNKNVIVLYSKEAQSMKNSDRIELCPDFIGKVQYWLLHCNIPVINPY